MKLDSYAKAVPVQIEEQVGKEDWPPRDWVSSWREQHQELVWRTKGWGLKNAKELHPKISIPKPVQPQTRDLLVHDSPQFHRLLKEKKIRALFYMGFETDECILWSSYGMANMQDAYQDRGYLCTIVRDCTATYELAESLEGLWKTRMTIASIESRWGHSISSQSLVESVRQSRPEHSQT